MTDVAWVLLAVAGVAGVVNWIAVAPRVQARAIEDVCKPLTTTALVGVACLLTPADRTQRAWFVVALLLSLAGDVFLMLPADVFVPGLASFLLAHAAYIGGLRLEHPAGRSLAIAGAAVAVLAVPVLVRLIKGARAQGHPELAPALTIYVGAISVMVAFAFASGDPWAAAGAGFFFASDWMIGWDRFVSPILWGRPAIMATYHVAQAALVLSLLY